MVARFYKDLRLGTTLVTAIGSGADPDAYTLVRKESRAGYALPHELSWLRHSSGVINVIHFKDDESVQTWLDLYEPTEGA